MTRFGIRYPRAATAERDLMSGDVILRFDGAAGDSLTVVLREHDARELLTGELRASRADIARALYVEGRIELDAYERELDRAISPANSVIPSPAERSL